MSAKQAPISDSISITDSTTQVQHGAIKRGIADTVNLVDALAESGVKATIVIDPSFAHLNGRAIGRGNVTRSPIREKLAIVNVTFGANMNYVTGGVLLDFSTIGTIERFTQVYLCDIDHLSSPFYQLFVPDTNNSAKLGKLKIYNSSGVELANGSALIQNVTCKAYIRGV